MAIEDGKKGFVGGIFLIKAEICVPLCDHSMAWSARVLRRKGVDFIYAEAGERLKWIYEGGGKGCRYLKWCRKCIWLINSLMDIN